MAVDRYAFVTNLSPADFALSEAEVALTDEVTREAQFAVAGEFVSGKHGKFEITERDIDTMIANYNSNLHPVRPTELSVDYDHHEGESAGWIKGLEKRVRMEGTRRVVELWGKVAWVKDAMEKIAARKYRYFSPMFSKNFTTPTGRFAGATLLGGALTNRPFLQGMAAITCSLGDDLAVPATTQRSSNMRLITVKDANGNDVQVDLDALAAIPEVKNLSAAAAGTPAPAAKPDAAVPTDLAATITSAVKAATDPIMATVGALQGTVTNLSSALQTQKADAQKAEFERELNAGVAAGKVAPAEKEGLMKLSAIEGGLDILKSNIAARIPSQVVKLNHLHGDGQAGGAEPTAQVGDRVVTLENAGDIMFDEVEKAKTELKLSTADAMTVVSQKQPELARMFQLSTRRA
jgi:phage I-like protein